VLVGDRRSYPGPLSGPSDTAMTEPGTLTRPNEAVNVPSGSVGRPVEVVDADADADADSLPPMRDARRGRLRRRESTLTP